MTVIDASVVVKWFVPEVASAAALMVLRQGDPLAGPSLLQVEVWAALARKAWSKEIAQDEALAAVDAWRKSLHAETIELIPEGRDLPRAFELSVDLNHPLQDCLYLALAERLRVELLTADQKFAAKAQSRYAAIRLLRP